MNCTKFYGPSVLLTALLLLATAVAWSQVEEDDGIALLMKSWRWESEAGESTIDFSTNTLMLLDGNPVEYALSRERITFPGGSDPIAYRYEGLTDRLTLTFPNGATTEYRRTIASVLSRRRATMPIDNGGRLFGKFCERSYPADGNLLVRAIRFYDDATFDVSPRPTRAGVPVEDEASLGTALLWGERILFSYDDGMAVEARVIARDEYGAVASFRYLRSVFTRGTCPEHQEPNVIVVPQQVTPQLEESRPPTPTPSIAPGAQKATEQKVQEQKVQEGGKEVKGATRKFGKTRRTGGKDKSGSRSTEKNSQRTQRGS